MGQMDNGEWRMENWEQLFQTGRVRAVFGQRGAKTNGHYDL